MRSLRLGPPDGSVNGWSTPQWVEWLEEESGVLRSVHHDDSPVCRRCRKPMFPDARGTTWDRCWPCNNTYDGVTRAVVPIAYSTSGQLTALIAQTKDEPQMWWLRFALVSLLDVFLRGHRGCLERRAGGRFDYVTVVPSHPSRRGGRDHLKELVSSMGDGMPGPRSWIWDLEMLEKTKPAAAPEHRGAIDPDLFRVKSPDNLAGRRVLLIDDLYTSGSTVASAASALLDRGADPPVVVTIGRHVDIYKSQPAMEWAREQIEQREYDPGACAVHNPPSIWDSF